MPTSVKKLRTCIKGHQYYKTSDCPVCPICEQDRRPKDGFLAAIPAPARRALEKEGITTLQQLSRFSEKELLQLHGIGPTAIPKLHDALAAENLAFKK